MTTVKTAITLPQDLMKDIIRRSRQAGLSRSKFVVEAVEAYIRMQDRNQLIGRINQAYAHDAEKDRRVRRSLERHLARAAQGTW